MATTKKTRYVHDEREIIAAASKPDTPATGRVVGPYRKDDGKWYEVRDDGTEHPISGSSYQRLINLGTSGNNVNQPTGHVIDFNGKIAKDRRYFARIKFLSGITSISIADITPTTDNLTNLDMREITLEFDLTGNLETANVNINGWKLPDSTSPTVVLSGSQKSVWRFEYVEGVQRMYQLHEFKRVATAEWSSSNSDHNKVRSYTPKDLSDQFITEGLRGAPVNNATALSALPAKHFELRRLSNGDQYVFELGRTPQTGDIADDATTGAWVKQTSSATRILDSIDVPVRSAGTNAGSHVAITFYDRDGNAYPPNSFLMNGSLTLYTGGSPLVFNNTVFNGGIALGHNKTGTVTFTWNDSANSMNGLSRINVIGTNGALNGNGNIVGKLKGTDKTFWFPPNTDITPPEEFITLTGGSATVQPKSWQFSTDGMNVTDGDKIIILDNHDINLPSTTNLHSIQFAPASGNWETVAASTTQFIPDAAWTFLNNQSLLFGSDILTVVADAANTNWIGFSGGEDAPSQEQRYPSVADLPDPTTVASGTIVVVHNDSTPTNNRVYTAVGPAGSNATTWI